MEVIVRRLFVRERSLFGTLAFEGEEPQCFTLEDMPRPTKIAGETCIPAGRYEGKLRTFGRLYEHYKARYPWNDPGMLWLQAVPNFADVLVHCGNTDKDTAGCLLVGARADLHRPSISSSLEAYERVYKRVMGELVRGVRVWFNIEEGYWFPI